MNFILIKFTLLLKLMVVNVINFHFELNACTFNCSYISGASKFNRMDYIDRSFCEGKKQSFRAEHLSPPVG